MLDYQHGWVNKKKINGFRSTNLSWKKERLSSIYIKECIHSLTHSTRPWRFYGRLGHEFWCTEALTSTKSGFCKILPPSKHVFERNSAPNYLTMTKLHMGRLDLNTKKSLSVILEFLILRGGMERKHWFFFGGGEDKSQKTHFQA